MNPITGFLIKAFFNHEFKRYGKMTHLDIDTTSKTIAVTAELAGEKEPLEARIGYGIEEADGKLFFVPHEVSCSREWMTLLAGELIRNGPVRVEIPSGLASIAVKMLRL